MTRAYNTATTQQNSGGVIAPFVAGKNKIINADCFYNQRGFSSQTLTSESGIFLVDRFSGVHVISGSSTFSVQQFALGTAPVAGYEAKQFIRAVTTGQDNGFTGTIFGQAIEDVRTLANQTVTISFWAKAASGTPSVSFEFRQVFGTGGSPSDTVEAAGGAQKFAISTSWTRYSRTITLPSIAGKTLGTNNNSRLECNIWVSAGAGFNARTNSLGIQSNTFDIWGLQVEAGSVATPFALATGTLATELTACQRYYYRAFGTANANWGLGIIVISGYSVSPVRHPVEMRVAPSTFEFNNLSFYEPIGAVNYTPDTIISPDSTRTSGIIRFNKTTLTNVGRVGYLNGDTNSYIAFSAEF
jgi:hypothetical protein